MTVVAVALLVAGAACSARAGLALTASNRGVPVPLWFGRPTTFRWADRGWRVAGAACAISGALLMGWPWWGTVALLVLAMAPEGILLVRHNRRVRDHRAGSAHGTQPLAPHERPPTRPG